MSRTRLLPVVAAVALSAGLFVAAAPAAPPTDDELKAAALKLNDLTDLDAMEAKLKELVKDKESAKKLVKVALKMQKDAGEKESPFKFNAGIVLAKVAHNVKDYDASEEFYRYCTDSATKLKSGKKMLQAYEGLMDLYWDQKKYDEVEKAAQQFVDAKGENIDVDTLFVMENMAKAKAKQGDVDKALQIADSLAKPPKIGTYFIQTKGWIYREAGKYADAVAAYEEFLEKIDDLKGVFPADARANMKKNTRYMLTGILVDKNDIDKAADILKKLIKDDPDNPTYYNDLGFIWADHDKNLEESEKLIRQALDLDAKQRKKLLDEGKISKEIAEQESAAYLDSLGWVLFKNKKYDEAYKYLKKASEDKDDGAHIEIWDHLADCLVAMGKPKEAVEVWTKALKFDDVSKRDTERRKTVTAKMKKLKAELAK